MRIRDIRQSGFYALPGTTTVNEGPPGGSSVARQFNALHVIGVTPMFVTELVRFVFVPITETIGGDVKLIEPDTLFGEDDGWELLCDGGEPDLGPHTFLMKLMELAGYSEDEARRIARDTLVENLDRQIYGSA
ncbi:MAG: hypothetical protein OXG72_15805 [Acidobacteria bacterium]|nr:hypothetical protein [Acidobacteriota bacterium]